MANPPDPERSLGQRRGASRPQHSPQRFNPKIAIDREVNMPLSEVCTPNPIFSGMYFRHCQRFERRVRTTNLSDEILPKLLSFEVRIPSATLCHSPEHVHLVCPHQLLDFALGTSRCFPGYLFRRRFFPWPGRRQPDMRERRFAFTVRVYDRTDPGSRWSRRSTRRVGWFWRSGFGSGSRGSKKSGRPDR